MCDLHEKKEVGLHVDTWNCSTTGNLQLQSDYSVQVVVVWLAACYLTTCTVVGQCVTSAAHDNDIRNVAKWLLNKSRYRCEARLPVFRGGHVPPKYDSPGLVTHVLLVS